MWYLFISKNIEPQLKNFIAWSNAGIFRSEEIVASLLAKNTARSEVCSLNDGVLVFVWSKNKFKKYAFSVVKFTKANHKLEELMWHQTHLKITIYIFYLLP